MFNTSQAHAILNGGATLDERLSNHELLATDYPERFDPIRAHKRWKDWQDRCGGAEFLNRRLSQVPFAHDTLLEVLGNSAEYSSHRRPEPTSRSHPTWFEAVRVAYTGRGQRFEEAPVVQDANPGALTVIPFAELLRPLVESAFERLNAAHPSALQRCNPSAIADLELQCLEELSRHTQKTFYLEFETFRRSASKRDPAFDDSTGTRLYRAFLERMFSGGLAELFVTYPVLVRILGTLVDRWIGHVGEVVTRLEFDRDDIERTLRIRCSRIDRISLRISDPHSRRRTVACLQFVEGARLIYKPRSLALESAFRDLAVFLNGQGLKPELRAMRVLDRSSYGWMEYAPSGECRSQDEVERYHQRCGALLCLAYVLQANDLHNENLVASSEYPVICDAETLFHHRPLLNPDSRGGDRYDLARRWMADSVLPTGLLPCWETALDGRAYDIAGIGGSDPAPREIVHEGLEHPNTDAMRWHRKTVRLDTPRHVAIYDGAPVPPYRWEAAIQMGFETTYRLLMRSRDRLRSASGPFALVSTSRARFLFRSTRMYALVYDRLTDPRNLRDGVDWSLQTEILVRPACQKSDARLWPIVHTERNALLNLEIPRFEAEIDSNRLLIDGVPTPGVLAGSSFDEVNLRLQQLSEDDLQKQQWLIRNALSAVDQSADTIQAQPQHQVRKGTVGSRQVTRDDLIAEARRIATVIRDRALQSKTDPLCWVGVDLLPNGRYSVRRLGPDLYSGVCGVALFYSGMARVLGDSADRATAIAALAPVRAALHEVGADLLPSSGAGTGFASIAYTLLRAGLWLEESSLTADGLQAARLLVNDPQGELESSTDALSGRSGDLLALLVASEADESLLATAIRVGDELLTRRTMAESGHRIWRSPSERRPLCGLSHGMAGIAMALERLARRTQLSRFHAAAREAIDYENTHFCSTSQNWPDLRTEVTSRRGLTYPSSWCHGATGIGFARLSSVSDRFEREVTVDIERAIDATRRFGLQAVDSVCCGNAGRIAWLHAAGWSLDRPELCRTASDWMMRILPQSRSSDGYSLIVGKPGRTFIPGFYQGLSGIGYTALQLAFPGELSNVLVWE